MRIKKLEWSITKGFMSDRWYARAMGIEWTIPVSNGTAQDNKRVEAEKEKAQSEFERDLKRWIEDGDGTASDEKPVRNSLMAQAALKTLVDIGYYYSGGEMWNPPSKRPPIVHVDDKGVATVVSPTAKDRVVDHLIQEHAEISKQHTKAIHAGQHGISPGLRERLKSIETSLAIAVKDADISPANEQKESGK